VTPRCTQAGNFFELEVHAYREDLLRLHEVVEQHAATAAQIEHARTGFDPVADDLHVDGAFDGEFAHGDRIASR